jgi:hypothetical protein
MKKRKYGGGGKVLSGLLNPASYILPESITQSPYFDPLADSLGVDTKYNRSKREMAEQEVMAARKKAGMKKGGTVRCKDGCAVRGFTRGTMR